MDNPPESLGVLIEVIRIHDPDEDICFVSSERVCRDIGAWRGPGVMAQ